MSGKRNDRRVSFTQRILCQALIDLLGEKPIRKITVTELCERADVNRGTFYSHFTDTYDLLHYAEQTAVGEISSYIRSVCETETELELRRAANALFTYIQKNQHFWRALLSPNGGSDYYQSLYDATYPYYRAKFIGGGTDEVYLRFMYTQIIIGCTGMIMRWLTEEPNQPPEVPARVLFDIIKQIR